MANIDRFTSRRLKTAIMAEPDDRKVTAVAEYMVATLTLVRDAGTDSEKQTLIDEMVDGLLKMLADSDRTLL